MKKSIVFFMIMTFGIITGMTTYSFALKKQYNAINRKDPFWDFEQKEVLNFSHIVMEGSNLVGFRIIRVADRRPGIALKKGIKEFVRYEVKDDTLFVKVDKKSTVATAAYRRSIPTKGIIFFEHLKNIAVHNTATSIEVKMKHPALAVSASGVSNIQFRTLKSNLQKLSIGLSNKTIASFQNFGKEIVLPELHISLQDSSSLDLKDVVAQKHTLKLLDKATIGMDANIWNAIEKEKCNLKNSMNPKTTLSTQE